MDPQAMEVVASVPRSRDLRCMVGKVNPTETESPSVTSRYHWPIFTCRLVIYSLPEVIASPANDVDANIHIITTESLFKTVKVQSVLVNLKIQCLRFTEVERQVYEACLYYTLLFNVAPMWNKVNNYLLQGRNFLSSSNRSMKAVKLNVAVTDEATRFLISPTAVRLPRLTLEYFSMSPKVIENFMTDETGLIEFNDPKAQAWVYVLPSLRKGRVMSVSRRIPESSPFKNYQQLKRHWKNMYGYRLPESEAGLIYYQVYFPWAGGACYTYPNHCLSPAELVQFRFVDAKNTALQFLQDLTEKIPKICGATLILKELRSCQSPNHFPTDDRKENIPNSQSSIVKRLDEIWKLRAAPYDVPCESTVSLLESSKNYIERFTTSYDDYEKKNSSKLLAERDRSGMTVCSPQLVESQIDKSATGSLNDKNKIGNNEELFSLVRNRSSFEFDEFRKALSGEDLFDRIMSGKLIAQSKSSDIDNEEANSSADGTTETRCRFFDNPRNESHGYVSSNSQTDYPEVKKGLGSSRVKLYRLSSKKFASSGKSTINTKGKNRLTITNFQTRDISSYFASKKITLSHRDGHEELGGELCSKKLQIVRDEEKLQHARIKQSLISWLGKYYYNFCYLRLWRRNKVIL